MSEIKLKRCPFCGGEATVNTVEPHKHAFATWMPDYTGGTFIECNNCSCAISGETEEEAIRSWNTRKPMQEIENRLRDGKVWRDLLLYDMNFREREIVRKAIEICKEVGGMND